MYKRQQEFIIGFHLGELAQTNAQIALSKGRIADDEFTGTPDVDEPDHLQDQLDLHQVQYIAAVEFPGFGSGVLDQIQVLVVPALVQNAFQLIAAHGSGLYCCLLYTSRCV